VSFPIHPHTQRPWKHCQYMGWKSVKLIKQLLSEERRENNPHGLACSGLHCICFAGEAVDIEKQIEIHEHFSFKRRIIWKSLYRLVGYLDSSFRRLRVCLDLRFTSGWENHYYKLLTEHSHFVTFCLGRALTQFAVITLYLSHFWCS